MNSLKTLAAHFQDGRINREEFWRTMQERHRQLQEYQELIGGTDVEAICIGHDELRVKTRDGIWMVWDPEDMGSVPNVLVNHGRYEPIESAYLLEAGSSAHVIFDVGANVGYYSLHWASRLAPGGRIYAFEPVPSTFAWFSRNIALNQLDTVILPNNCGVGNATGVASIFVPDFMGSGAASMKDLHPDETSRSLDIRLTTLDEYFSISNLNRLDLIKADVEGAELLVVKGGLQTIAKYRPLIFLELLRKWSKPFGYHPNDVIRLLADMGYRCYTFGEGGLMPFEAMTDETTQKNFFFAHPDVHQNWLSANNLQ